VSRVEWDDLGREIYGRGHLTGEFWLRSGGISHDYFDQYQFESDPRLLRDVAEELIGLLPDGVDMLAGMELGGVPLAAVCSQRCGLPTVFVRKRPSRYGTRKRTEGASVAGARVAVIKDVVTAGTQVLEACRDLEAKGAEIAAVVCVVDRGTGGSRNLERAGLTLRSLFTLSEISNAGALP
jgi:orotate phosphoribosyltransferase